MLKVAALSAAVLSLPVTPSFASSADSLWSGYGHGAQDCLTRIIYHEARGESDEGQMAVAEVVINRAKSGEFPKTICGVVRQGGQFTSTRGAIREHAAFQEASEIATLAVEGKTGNLSRGATYFHTPRVKPSWSNRFVRVARIGNHIFYKP